MTFFDSGCLLLLLLLVATITTFAVAVNANEISVITAAGLVTVLATAFVRFVVVFVTVLLTVTKCAVRLFFHR